MKRYTWMRAMVGSFSVAAALAGATTAHAHSAFDIMPYYDAAQGKIVIGGVTHASTENPITGDPVPGGGSAKFRIDEWSVFGYEFNLNHPSFPTYTTALGINYEPGNYIDLTHDPVNGQPVSLSPTNFAPTYIGIPGGDSFVLRAASALQAWDDVAEAFVAADGDISLSIWGSDDLGILVSGDAFSNHQGFAGAAVDGILTSAGLTYGFHDHMGATIADASPSGVEVSHGVRHGIYAFQAQLHWYDGSYQDTGVTSDTFWIVYNYGMNDDLFHEAQANLNGDEHHHHSPVPEPATASLLVLGAGAMLLRRRR